MPLLCDFRKQSRNACKNVLNKKHEHNTRKKDGYRHV
jgi:hypothetical protein